MFDRALVLEAKHLLDTCRDGGLKLATAESCTGGLVAALLTDIAGSSAVFERGFVTYSNEAKAELLGVPMDLIERHGAVSEQVARAMAEGALARSRADIAVSVTGIAGPDGGTAEKPVGLVHFAAARRGHVTHAAVMRFGDQGREKIRELSVATALEMVIAAVREGGLTA
jgi:nicotinamide-nucleotide amidase